MRPVNLTASSETIFNLFSCQAFIVKADQKHGISVHQFRATPSAIPPPIRSAKSPINGRANRVALFKLTTQEVRCVEAIS
jgi:hypothetical protein